MIRQVTVAIIGAGPAGLAAVAEVRKATRDFVLIDSGGFARTCARIGCRPSAVADYLAAGLSRRRLVGVGGRLGSGLLGLDEGGGAVYPRGAHGVGAAAPERADLPAAALIPGEARFIGPTTLRAGGQTIQARSIVIATGAGSDVPPYWRELLGDRLLTVETLFARERLPGSVAVIGLGAPGVQLGQVLHRLGVRVIGIESRESIAGVQDPFVNRLAVDLLGREFPLWLGTPALVEPRGDAVLVRAGSHQALVDRVLVAVGRHPALERLNLAQAGCALDGRGVPLHHPAQLRVGRLPIYIAGDAAGGVGGLALTTEQGRVAGYNACHRTPIGLAARPPTTVVYSEPMIAWVGPAWSTLDQRFLLTGQLGLDAPPAEPGRHRDLLRIYADCRDGRVLGGAMLGPDCEDLAQALAGALAQQLTVQRMAELPLADPAIAAVLRATCNELSRRIRPVEVSPRARGRLMTWCGRAVKAPALPPLGSGLWLPDAIATSGLACEAE